MRLCRCRGDSRSWRGWGRCDRDYRAAPVDTSVALSSRTILNAELSCRRRPTERALLRAGCVPDGDSTLSGVIANGCTIRWLEHT